MFEIFICSSSLLNKNVISKVLRSINIKNV